MSGGNLDANLLARLISRHETRVGRRVRLSTRVPDRPGGLVGLLGTVAAAGANVIELSHARDDADLPVAQTGVELLLELRGDEHADALATRLSAAGYPSSRRDEPGGGCADESPGPDGCSTTTA